MSNPYSTCPSQFYEQFRLARQQQMQQNNGMVLPMPVNQRQTNRRQSNQISQQQINQIPQQQYAPMNGMAQNQIPNKPRRNQYASQTLNTKDYQRMAKQAQLYNNNPRNIPVVNQVVYEQPNNYMNNRYNRQEMNHRRDTGRLQEIRNQIQQLNQEVEDICMRNDFDSIGNMRMGAIAPNPMSMKMGGRIQQNMTMRDDVYLNDEFDYDNEFFSPCMSPPSMMQNFTMNTFDNDDDDWFEDDYSIPQPIQMHQIQTMRPNAVRHVNNNYEMNYMNQPIPQQMNPPMMSQRMMQQQMMNQSVPQQMNQMSPQPQFTNPYRQKKQSNFSQPRAMNVQAVPQQMMQPPMQRQPMRFQPSQQWQSVNSAFGYYE